MIWWLMMMQTKHVSKPNIIIIFSKETFNLYYQIRIGSSKSHTHGTKQKKKKKELTSTEVVENDNNK